MQDIYPLCSSILCYIMCQNIAVSYARDQIVLLRQKGEGSIRCQVTAVRITWWSHALGRKTNHWNVCLNLGRRGSINKSCWAPFFTVKCLVTTGRGRYQLMLHKLWEVTAWQGYPDPNFWLAKLSSKKKRIGLLPSSFYQYTIVTSGTIYNNNNKW